MLVVRYTPKKLRVYFCGIFCNLWCMFRRRCWLAFLAGDEKNVKEARDLNMGELVRIALEKNSAAVAQIDLDIPRSGESCPEKRQRLRRVLLAWCALNGFGYVQGMNLVAAVLLKNMSGSSTPEHDALACLSGVMVLNGGLIPLHAEDREPMQCVSIVVSKLWLQISLLEPKLETILFEVLDFFEIACLRCMSVCFVNFFSSETLETVWDYIFDEHRKIAKTSDKCRHVLAAAVLYHKKLWVHGKDARQSYAIFEAVCKLLTDRQVGEILDLAKHLERLEFN